MMKMKRKRKREGRRRWMMLVVGSDFSERKSSFPELEHAPIRRIDHSNNYNSEYEYD